MPKIVILIGLILVVVGLAWQFVPGLFSWFGRLPGDIVIERGDSRIFIPITSMIVVSLVLSIVLNVFFRR